MTPVWLPWYVVACYRSTYLSLLLMSATGVMLVRSHRVRGMRRHDPSLAQLVAALVRDYGVRRIVVEPGGRLERAVRMVPGVVFMTISLPEAKGLLVPTTQRLTSTELCQHLIEEYPKLRRCATVLSGTGRIAMSDRGGVVTLLAAALGLAAQRLFAHDAGGTEAVPSPGFKL